MAYASSRHAVRRLADEARAAARARAPRLLRPGVPAPARRSTPRAPSPRVARVPSRGFAGASSASLARAAATAGAGSAGSAGWRSWLGAAFLLSPSAVCVGPVQVAGGPLGVEEGGARRRAKSRACGGGFWLDLRDLTARAARARRGVHRVPSRARCSAGGPCASRRRARRADARPSTSPPCRAATAHHPARGEAPPRSAVARARAGEPRVGARGVARSPRAAVPATSGVTRASARPRAGSRPPTSSPRRAPTRRWSIGGTGWTCPAIAASLGLPEHTPLVQLTRGGAADRGNAAPTSFPAPVALADLRAFEVAPRTT